MDSGLRPAAGPGMTEYQQNDIEDDMHRGPPAIMLVAAVAENGVIGSGNGCRGGSGPTCSISVRSPWASR